MKNELISIKEAAKILCLCQKTLRLYEEEGKITPVYTAGGHRRYKRSDIEKMAGALQEEQKATNKCAIYARVSSSEQKTKGDLERQVGRLTGELLRRGYSLVESFDEVGSGMNDKRVKLHKLMKLATERKIDVVLIEHKDRLTRFSFEYLKFFFNSYDVQIVIVDDILTTKSYEAELVEDILSLMASFSSKIYGRRSSQNRKKKEEQK